MGSWCIFYNPCISISIIQSYPNSDGVTLLRDKLCADVSWILMEPNWRTPRRFPKYVILTDSAPVPPHQLRNNLANSLRKYNPSHFLIAFPAIDDFPSNMRIRYPFPPMPLIRIASILKLTFKQQWIHLFQLLHILLTDDPLNFQKSIFMELWFL